MKTFLFREKIRDIVPDDVLFDEPTKRYTSIGVGGIADALIFPRNREELRRLVSFLREQGLPYISVGNWTNLIVRDGGYRGIIVSLKKLDKVKVVEKDANNICIFAEAGVCLSKIVSLCLEESLTGMEFCAGIPGSVGGAVTMNAGAFGNEMKNVVDTLTIMSGKGEICIKGRNQLTFEYRKLHLEEGDIILDASLALKRGIKDKIEERIYDILEQRKKKHPLEYPSAGSIFKNPPDDQAGRIIDRLGLKGTRIGGAQISEKHANFIINTGNAKASDILDLIEIIKKAALKEMNVKLETEVKIVGVNG